MRLRRWLFRLALSAPVLLTNADRGAKLKWMSLARRLRRLVLAAAAFGTAAGCAGRPAEQPAAAKASGQEKAVRLTLRLHKRDIRVGEPLRVQFVLTNVGPEKIPVLDDLYRHPEALDHNLSERWGTYVEVQGPEGDALGSWILLHASPANEAHFCDGPSRGPSYNPWKPGDERAIQLGPGESIATKTWSRRAACSDEPRFEEVPPFITVDDRRPLKPGKHRIRAVYAWGPEPGKAAPASRSHYELDARTDWIEFDAAP